MTIATKALPIDLDGEDVRAVLETGQTQILVPSTREVDAPPHSFGLGQTFWVREALRGVFDTTIDPDETMPICAYAADGAHLWTKDKFREPWRWDGPTLSSHDMPRWASRLVVKIIDAQAGASRYSLLTLERHRRDKP